MKERAVVSYDIVDLAYQIIDMHKENISLRQELNHYEGLREDYLKSLKSSEKHTKEMTGIILSAVLDPKSVINKGHEAILKEKEEVTP